MVRRDDYVRRPLEVALSRSPFVRLSLALFCLAGTACDAGGSGGVPTPGTTPTADARLEDWATLPEGTSVPVALGFARTLPDSVVAGLLERHSLRPYAVFLKAGDQLGTHARERSRASLEVLAEAREQTVQQMRTSLCAQQGRARSLVEQPETGSLDDYRQVLSRSALLQETVPKLELGEPMIYGVVAVGTLEDVRAVKSDPELISFEPGWRTKVERVDTIVVPEPAAPTGGPSSGIDPVIAALPQDKVTERIKQLAETGVGSCEEASGSVEEKP
jgi:hypothetical protein